MRAPPVRTMRAAIVAAVIAAAGTRASASSFDLIEPVWSAVREIEERGPSPHYYRLPPDTIGYLSRTTLGTHTRLSGDTETDFALDLLTGASIRFGRDSALGLWIEGGYAYVKGREHLAVLGVGVARRAPGIASSVIAVIPHLVAGTIEGERCLGVRTSLVLAPAGMVALEVAHQVGFVGGARVHELHVGISFPFVSGER